MSLLPPAQTLYLAQMFELVDKAIVLKVLAGKAMQARDFEIVKKIISDYSGVLSQLLALTATDDLKPVASQIYSAIKNHQRYFMEKQKHFEVSGQYDNKYTPDIYQASDNLKQAYGLLMQQFAHEQKNNKIAFYDYLCALDFI